jgi:hypothetical protein
MENRKESKDLHFLLGYVCAVVAPVGLLAASVFLLMKDYKKAGQAVLLPAVSWGIFYGLWALDEMAGRILPFIAWPLFLGIPVLSIYLIRSLFRLSLTRPAESSKLSSKN